MIAEVITRLDAQVSDLAGRVQGAADFAELMRRNQLPQVTPAAHVLGLGMTGGRGESATGFYTQIFDQVIGVVLTVRSHSATGVSVLDDTETLIMDVIRAVVGWGPNDEIGVFRLLRGNLVSMQAGTLVYKLDFSITDQLRVTP